MKKVLLTVAAVLAATANASAWEVISGQNCSVSQPQMVSAHDSQSLAQIWAKTYQGTPKALELPAVDFSKETVIAVFLGEKPTQGYNVDIQFQQDPMNPKRLYVLYKEQAPKSVSFQPQVVSRPYVIRKVPKAYNEVVFEADQTVRALPPTFKNEKSDQMAGIIFKLQQTVEAGSAAF
ncbi:MAG: protease complex subunit PrcB family protein [Elusimicrobia bacterium]|nr:protease complex subunit PrcB family protein [Elusimicrobiota bacterium]